VLSSLCAPPPASQVAVLGGGLMGSGIATACILAGMDVVLKEVNQQFLDVGTWLACCLWCLCCE
jgi:hypothetical protein